MTVAERSPEKAGVGGSIPSLATIPINELAGIIETPSVSIQSAIGRCCQLFTVSQNRQQRQFLRCHAVLGHAMCVQLQGGSYIRMPQQSLHGLRIGLGAHQE